MVRLTSLPLSLPAAGQGLVNGAASQAGAVVELTPITFLVRNSLRAHTNGICHSQSSLTWVSPVIMGQPEDVGED